MRILVVTRSYPASKDLYQYPFVHRRVLAYAEAGHDVAVFRPTDSLMPSSHEFESVACISGDKHAFEELARDWQPDVIAAHGFSEQTWPVLVRVSESVPVRAWLHGSEIPAFFRRKALSIADPAERATALDTLEKRCSFWAGFLPTRPDRFKLVFPSISAVDLAREDWGSALREKDYSVVPNPIDTNLFSYQPKMADDRRRILIIRPFDSWTYGNDLAVAAILELNTRFGVDDLHFTIIGDGPLFQETLEPLRGARNVRIEQGFVTQRQIAREHSRHGTFLVPTRLDTQGVSRDEAMSSGLVPVTNRIPAVLEFVDDDCAGLAPPNDASGLADALAAMIDDPDLFLRKSAAAAERVRHQSGHKKIITVELDLLAESLAYA